MSRRRASPRPEKPQCNMWSKDMVRCEKLGDEPPDGHPQHGKGMVFCPGHMDATGVTAEAGVKRHELKTWPASFEAIVRGEKRHEVRKADRDFAVGDELVLLEFVPCERCKGTGRVREYMESDDCGCEKPHGRFTGSVCRVKVTYVTRGGTFGVPEDMVVMSVVKKSNWDKPCSAA